MNTIKETMDYDERNLRIYGQWWTQLNNLWTMMNPIKESMDYDEHN